MRSFLDCFTATGVSNCGTCTNVDNLGASNCTECADGFTFKDDDKFDTCTR